MAPCVTPLTNTHPAGAPRAPGATPGAYPPPMPDRTLRLGHSPDPDDAFMWWPLADFTTDDGTVHRPQIDTAGYRFEHILEDIESLNQRSARAELEITALSIHQFPHVAKDYVLTTCGSSMGDGYGPMIVTRPGHIAPDDIRSLKGKRLAVPGVRTTAWLSTQLCLAEHGLSADDLDWEPVMFDEIPARIADGSFDAGVIIHEGQITFERDGLALVRDLGAWWTRSRGLPLPLGGNAIRRDLIDAGEGPRITRVLLNSIQHALQHREQAVAFAMHWARGMDHTLADRFVGMYVNDWTLDYGERGIQAVTQLLTEAKDANLIPAEAPIDFVRPG